MSDASLERFWNACRALGPLRLEIEDRDGDVVLEHSSPRPFVQLGRDETNDFPLRCDSISKRHLFLLIIQGRLFAIDLESRSGSRREGNPFSSSWIDPQQAIEVGPYRIFGTCRPLVDNEFPMIDRPDPLHQPCLTTDATDPPWILEFPEGPGGGPITRPVSCGLTLIGRASACAIQSADSSVSRFHCGLLRTDDGLWLIDFSSRGGTKLNRWRVRWARCKDGDRITFGRHTLVIRRDDGQFPPASALDLDAQAWPRAPLRLPNPAPENLPAVVVRHPLERVAQPTWSPPSLLPHQPNDQTAAMEALLMPVVQQLTSMQQQMFDQFHQAMLAMFQLVGQVHQDHRDQVRQELEDLRRVTFDLQAIQTELGHQGRRPAFPMQPSKPSPNQNQNQSHNAFERPATESVLNDPPPNRTKRPSAPPPPHPGIHAQLVARMAELERERQTKWQRLMSRLTSLNAGAEPGRTPETGEK